MVTQAEKTIMESPNFNIAPGNHLKLISEVRRQARRKIQESSSDFNMFFEKFPNGVDYHLGREIVENKNYIKVQFNGRNYFVLCNPVVWKGISCLKIEIFSNTFFESYASKNIFFHEDGVIEENFSRKGVDDSRLQEICSKEFIKAFFDKIKVI